MRAIHRAVASGDLNRVRSLISRGFDLDGRDAEGRTPLYRAIELHLSEIAIYLVRNGAFLGDETDEMTALHVAAVHGDLDTVRAILARPEATPAYVSLTGRYPCHHSIHFSHFGASALLFSLCGTDIDDLYPRYFYADIALALLAAGADPNDEDSGSITPLFRCVFLQEGVGTREERLAVMRALLEAGAFLDPLTQMDWIEKMQPLHGAACTGFLEAARLLIEYGAPVNPQVPWGAVPPLYLAPFGGCAEIFELLLQHGAAVDFVDSEDNNVLHYCIGYGFGFELSAAKVPAAREMLIMALKRGADVHQAGNGHYGFNEEHSDVHPIDLAELYDADWVVAPLLIYGDRSLELFPSPCYSLVDALMPLWKESVEGLPQIFKSLKLEAQELGRAALLTLHRVCSALPEGPLWTILEAVLEAPPAAEREQFLSRVFKRLEAPVQVRVRTALLVMKRFGPKMPEELIWDIMAMALA